MIFQTQGSFRESLSLISTFYQVRVEPHELVKQSGGLEQASVHWHAVAYANKHRADGHVEPILPERGVFRKRQKRRGHQHDP